MNRLALISMHGCPLARLGEKDSGGLNVYVLQIAKHLGRLGYKVDVFTRTHDAEDPNIVEVDDNTRIIHVEAGPLVSVKHELYDYSSMFRKNIDVFRISEGTKYDLIHSHYWLSGYVGSMLCSDWQVPHVVTFHTLARTKIQARFGESEPAIRELTESHVSNSADLVIVSTEEEKNDLARLYGVPKDRVTVVTAGVDLDMFQPLDKTLARKMLGLKESRIILSVGRIDPLKGVDILIRAVSMMDETTDIKVVIVGGEPTASKELRQLTHMVNSLGLTEILRFDGIVSQDMLPTYYSASDIFVMPSYYESFGLVALEAMACGVPVVASRVGGPRSLIRQGENGYLIPWRCPEPFSQKLEMLLSNDALRKNMASASLATAKHLDWSTTATKLSHAYSSHLNTQNTNLIGA